MDSTGGDEKGNLAMDMDDMLKVFWKMILVSSITLWKMVNGNTN